MKVAIVGCTLSQFNGTLLAELSRNHEVDIRNASLIEVFDLALDQDFLQDERRWDVVVLCHIFRYREEELTEQEKMLVESLGSIRTSPLHSAEKWRERLLATNAQKIIIFCDNEHTCVDDEYLGMLLGYRRAIAVHEYRRTVTYKQFGADDDGHLDHEGLVQEATTGSLS